MRNFKNIISVLSILLLAVIFYQCSGESQAKTTIVEVVEPEVEESLYVRLGSAEGISSLVDDIFDAHMNNPILNDKFDYLRGDTEKEESIKSHMRNFLGSGTGGIEQYTGRDIPTIHTGMNITEAEFLAVVDDIMIVLNNHEMSDQTKKDMLYILYSFKGQVVGL